MTSSSPSFGPSPIDIYRDQLDKDGYSGLVLVRRLELEHLLVYVVDDQPRAGAVVDRGLVGEREVIADHGCALGKEPRPPVVEVH